MPSAHYRGKAAGLYEDRLRLTGGPSDAELIDAIEGVLGKHTAEAMVLPWVWSPEQRKILGGPTPLACREVGDKLWRVEREAL